MYKFLVTLHVLAAVLVVGPLALAGFAGRAGIRDMDAARVRRAGAYLVRLALGSLLVVILGAGALGSSDRYTFRTPWVIISVTLYLVAMGVATGYTVPALRNAANLVEQHTGVAGEPVPAAPAVVEPPPGSAAIVAPTGPPAAEAPPGAPTVGASTTGAPTAGASTGEVPADEPPTVGAAGGEAPGTGAAADAAAAARGAELSVVKERLDNVAGRVAGSAVLVTVILAIVTILMVTRPFGR